ncbi:thiamine transport system permease protein [Pseudorhizobium tarimense]|uniref:Thiamine transport system permease protein n=1 Tax=Pseudorhizobium tarimense TaxID=1079109 RepID=A0ABV2H823_9HYPH|nr:thiamine/thiamine pyrophosphate ABC transporter permease ThiP [Pseudorhizobium tarimense]MCJ8519908.1 thiamine/thiamine pyrophosphate ABC transporter permease ThiP [Pseudorhizobium tarimense]
MLTVRERWTGIGGSAVALGAILVFIAAAVLALLLFQPASSGGAIFTSYTWNVLRFTLLQAALSTALATGLAIPVALSLARRPHFFGRIWILRLMALPMGLPVLVVSLGLIAVWGRQGIANDLLLTLGLSEPISIYGLSGILLAHIFFNLPLACRLMVASLERLPGEYWKLAASLRLTPLSLFRFIEWPALRQVLPGIAGLIFMLCATSFTIVLVLGGGPAATTLEVAIYQSLRFDFDPPRAIALSLLQIALTGLVLALLGLVKRAEENGTTLAAPSRRFDGWTGTALVWDVVTIAMAVLFLLLPLLAVFMSGLRADLGRLLTSSAFMQAAATSAAIAVASTLLASFVSICIIKGRLAVTDLRDAGKAGRTYRGLLGASSSLVLLVPPVVLGTGWFLLLRPVGDVSCIAPFLVSIINALMALPFVMRVLEPSMQTHHDRTSRLVAGLGISGVWKLWHIDRPVLLKPALLALSFAMALSLGDLGAVALFGSNDFVTLPWLLYSRLSSYRTADADGLALILGVLCLLLTIAGTFERPTERSGHAAG